MSLFKSTQNNKVLGDFRLSWLFKAVLKSETLGDLCHELSQSRHLVRGVVDTTRTIGSSKIQESKAKEGREARSQMLINKRCWNNSYVVDTIIPEVKH